MVSRSAWACSAAAVVDRVPSRAAAKALGIGRGGSWGPSRRAWARGEPTAVHGVSAAGEDLQYPGRVELRQGLGVFDTGLQVGPGVAEPGWLVGGCGADRDLAVRGPPESAHTAVAH